MKYSSILEAVWSRALETPDKLCVADAVCELTYAQYQDRIRRYAAVLEAKGIRAGQCLVVECQQRADYTAMELAIQYIGAIFVPMENKCAPEKLVAIAKRCEAHLLVTIKALSSEEVPCITYAQIAEAAAGVAPAEHSLPEGNRVSEILFSTGTTGKEKGIVISHQNDVAVAENIAYGAGFTEETIEMIPSPLNHSHGLRSYYANMISGSTVILLDSVMDLKRLFANMDRYKVNAMDLVPAALAVIFKLSGRKLGEYKDQLKFLEFGSAAMMASDKELLLELFPGMPLYNFYGSTESGRAVVYNFNNGVNKKGCIGKPTHNTTVIMLDPETRKPIESSASHTGLLASAGPMNMIGYYKDQAETDSVLHDGYVYSNDEAYFDEDGEIILLGRLGDVINVGGNKVSPEEIENIAKQFPGVADCGCVPVKDPIMGAAPKLVLQLEPGTELDSKAIKSFIASKVEPYKVPKVIETIDQIPRTFNGKLIRRKLY